MSKEKHTLIRDGKRLLWYTERLWSLSKDLPVKQVPINDIPEFEQNCWFQSRSPTVKEVAAHAKRIFAADLTYPVILNDRGGLMDGGHRLSKAYLEGQTHVLAVQFDELPEPDAEVPGQFVSIETERLKLREFVTADAESLFNLYRLPETSQFESWQPHKSIEETRGLLQYFVDQSYRQPRSDFTLAVEYQDQFIGLCGLELGFGTETDDDRCGFLGFRLDPKHWGKGFATEAGAALMNYGFNVLGLHRVHAGCSSENQASIRVLEKLGLQLEGTTRKSFPVGDDWHDYHLFGRLENEN